MATPAVLFRVDASLSLGTGHLARCLALALHLKADHVNSVFVMRDAPLELARAVGDAGFALATLAGGADTDADAAFTLRTALAAGARLVLADLSNSDWLARRDEYISLFAGLMAGGLKVAAFDDPSSTDFDCHLKIIPYLDAVSALGENTRAANLRLGPEYFVLRDEFTGAAPHAVREPADTVLVTMGGSDPRGLTSRVARALIPLGLKLMVVAGTAFAEDHCEALAAIMPGHGELIFETSQMAALMRRADLVVSAGGLTKYEAAASGAPLLLLSQNESEAAMSRAFAVHGLARHLGLGARVSGAEVSAAVSEMLADAGARREMTARQRGLVDGQGASRIIEALRPYML